MQKISALSATVYENVEKLDKLLKSTKSITCAVECATHYKDEVLPTMRALRAAADELEGLVSSKYWPFPTYGDLLFNV
jgi:glutamine synthetase